MKEIRTCDGFPAGRLLRPAAAVMLLALAGCEGMLPITTPEAEGKAGKYEFIEHTDRKMTVPEEPDPGRDLEAPSEFDAPAISEADLSRLNTPGSGKDGEIRPETPRREVNFYDDMILLDADDELEVAMIFNASPILDVLPAFADLLGFNYEVDREVSGVVNLNFNSTMTRRELWACFDRMLRLTGATAIADGDSLRIIPLSKMAANSPLRTNGRGTGGMEVISRSLGYASASSVAEQLKNFVTPSGIIIPQSGGNIITVCDLPENIAKLEELISIIDQPGRSSWPRSVIACRNVKPSALAAELGEILPVLGLAVSTSGNSGDDAGAIHLTGIDRLQLIVATAATDEAVAEIRNWVSILDNSDPGDQERVYVYKVANGKADQLAQALSVVFSTQGTTLTVDTDTGNNRTNQLNTASTRTQTSGGSAAGNLISSVNRLSNTQSDRSSDIFSAPVRVFADGVYNRLVIRTTPRTYAMIKALLDRLDNVPAQVLLQVLIAEVSLNDSTEFGMEFSFAETHGTTNTIIGSNFESLSDANMPDGYSMTIQDVNDPENKFATVKALAGRDNVKIISSPQLLVNSNTQAYIQIGNQVPLLSSDYTNVDSSGTTQRSYRYQDTGIIMTITPQVTSTNLISLEIDQEVSEAVKNTITSASDTPVIQRRKMTTAMTIANGRTMIIGGMIQEKFKDNLQGLPIIADLPIIGRLFGNTEQSVERVELLVLVTGYIVSEQSPVEEMIRRYDRSVRELSEFEKHLAEADQDDSDED